MKSAYYSRANSYSRSYNAIVAESEGRKPLTRAAQQLGLTVAAFKKGLAHADIYASEWHHVGKFANRVDYYDVTEIRENYKFWFGVITKYNKEVCLSHLHRIALDRVTARCRPTQIATHKESWFEAFQRRCNELQIYQGNRVPDRWGDMHLSTENLLAMGRREQAKRHQTFQSNPEGYGRKKFERVRAAQSIAGRLDAFKTAKRVKAWEARVSWLLTNAEAIAAAPRIACNDYREGRLFNGEHISRYPDQQYLKEIMGLTWAQFDAKSIGFRHNPIMLGSK